MKLSRLITVLMGRGGIPYADKLLTIQPTYLVGGWPLNDASGLRAACSVAQTYTGNIAYNGDMELAGHGGAVAAAGWYARAGGGTIAAETTDIHGGARAVKLTEGASTWIYQTIVVKPGQTYAYSFFTHGDGTHPGKYGIKNVSDNLWFVTLNTTTGVAGTEYTEVTGNIIVPATCSEVTVYLQAGTGAGSIAYYDDFTLTGTVDFGAAYVASGATLGVTGIGDGQTAVSMTGTYTYLAVQGALFNSLFDPDLGSAIAWGKMSAAEWGDATELRYLFHAKSTTDANCYIVFGKHTDAKTLFWRRKTGLGTNENQKTYVFAGDPPDGGWFCMGYSWDTSTPRLKGYLYVPGVLAWTKVFDVAGAQVASLAAHDFADLNTCLLAGSSVPGANAQEWMGDGAYIYLWAGLTLSDAEMQAVMTA